jgi:transcription termination factor Rho
MLAQVEFFLLERDIFMTEYDKLSLVELRIVAKKMGIKSVTSYKKLELLAKVKEVAATMESTDATPEMDDIQSVDHVVESTGEAVDSPMPRSRYASESDNSRMEESGRDMNRGYVSDREPMRTSSYMRDPEMGMARGGYSRNEGMSRGGYTRNDNMSRGGYSRNDNMGRGGYMNRDNMGRGVYSRSESMNRSNYSRNEGYRNDGYRNDNMDRGGYVRNDNRGYHADLRPQLHRAPQHELTPTEIAELDSGVSREGILEVLPEGYGFIRCDNYLPGERDLYVSPQLIRKYHLRTGDILNGNIRIRNQNEKFAALLYIKEINGNDPDEMINRPKFEQLTPVFPDERLRLETPGCPISMRMMDLIAPIGKGQRGMIVSQPKTGKTTLLKQVAKAVKTNHPKMHLIVLLIDERPEEVTDIKESILGHNVEVIFSTFDELPENHKRVSEMVIERAKRLVEQGEEVMILLDSITRLARAYNLTVQPSGRTLSGGLDPAALHMPKRFFGAARNMREGGSLTILATALVDTGSKMDDVVFEEFKGTGNMELVLDRKLSEKRVFPAIDLPRSSTRRDDLLLTQEEMEANFLMRKALTGMKSEEAVERIIEMFRRTKSNQEFIQTIRKTKIV